MSDDSSEQRLKVIRKLLGRFMELDRVIADENSSSQAVTEALEERSSVSKKLQDLRDSEV